MASAPKITLSASRDIPFNKLLLSACNVRRIKAGVSIEQLADDIARRGLLQSLTVRAVLDADGAETGSYEIPAGGRRYRALELLVRQKRLARTAPIPCVLRTEGLAEEDSLAENVQRAPPHPLDQFRAFLALREKGQSEEEIAAAFFVPIAVVRQRLRLAAVSAKLLDAYADDAMTLEQLIAFTVSADHERQEQVWERLQSSYSKEPYAIRRLLTESTVRASDKRTRFIGLDTYEAAGGVVLRDLFESDGGGWCQDVALVERLVAERLVREAEAVRAEGWRWVEAAPEFPYGHTFGLRRLRGEAVPLSRAEAAARDALQAEYDQLESAHAVDEDLPETVDARLGEIEAALAALDARPAVFDPAELARAGAFVSIDRDGALTVERGYVRPEDEAPVLPEPDPQPHDSDDADDATFAHDPDASADTTPIATPRYATPTHGPAVASSAAPPAEPEEDDGFKPLPDRLLAELTTHRTLALRQAIGEQPAVAFLAALHALCLKVFYPSALDSCLELELKLVSFGAQAPGLSETASAKAIGDRQQAWVAALPRNAADLWDALEAADDATCQRLFAHCIGSSVNAVHEAFHRRPRALAHADRLARAVRLDMAAAGWMPTMDSYLGRVTKARILRAVREGRGQPAAQRLEQLKKADMAEQAATLLAGSGWLPEPLRTPGQPMPTATGTASDSVDDAAPPAGEPVAAPAADAAPDEDNADTLPDGEHRVNDRASDPAGHTDENPAGDWPVAAE